MDLLFHRFPEPWITFLTLIFSHYENVGNQVVAWDWEYETIYRFKTSKYQIKVCESCPTITLHFLLNKIRFSWYTVLSQSDRKIYEIDWATGENYCTVCIIYIPFKF